MIAALPSTALLAQLPASGSLWDAILGINLELPTWTLYLAVAINGLSGAAYAARRGFDFTGVIGMAVIQGLGGLILLSVLLQTGVPFVLTNVWYIIIATTAGLAGFFFAAAISQALQFAVVLDALAMGLFVVIGSGQALQVAVNPLAAILLGVLTATGGLILRDIMAGSAPLILRPGVWVGVVALAGSTLFVVMIEVFDAPLPFTQLVTVLFVGILRTLAARFGWKTGKAQDLSERMTRYWKLRA